MWLFVYSCWCIIDLQISLLDSAVNHLKANIKSASDLINFPTTVEELQKVGLYQTQEHSIVEG